MQNEKIKFREVFKEGWKLTKANIGFLLGYMCIYYFFYFVGSLSANLSAFPILALFCFLLFTCVLDLGLYGSANMITKGIKPRFNQLYSNWRSLGSYLVASILWSLVFLSLVGLAYLCALLMMKIFGHYNKPILYDNPFFLAFAIVAGLWTVVRYGLFPFFLVDKKNGPINALKNSYEATRGNGWALLWIILVSPLIGIIGVFFFGIGLALAYEAIFGNGWTPLWINYLFIFLSMISTLIFVIGLLLALPLTRLVLGVAYNKLSTSDHQN